METMVNQERSGAEAGGMEQVDIPLPVDSLAGKGSGVTQEELAGVTTTQQVKEPMDDGIHIPPPEPVAPVDIQLARNPSFTSIASGGRPGSAASTGLVTFGGGGEYTPGTGDVQHSQAWTDPSRLAAFLLARQQRLEGLHMQVCPLRPFCSPRHPLTPACMLVLQVMAQVSASDSLAFSAKETDAKVTVHVARSKRIPEALMAARDTLVATVSRRDAAVTAVSQAGLSADVTQELPQPTDVSGLLDAKELTALTQGQSMSLDSDTPTPTPSAMPVGPTISVRDVIATRPEQPLADAASAGGKAKQMSFRMANTSAARSKPSGFTPLPGQIVSPGSASGPLTTALSTAGLVSGPENQAQGSEPASTASSALTAPFNGPALEQGETAAAVVVDHNTPRPDVGGGQAHQSSGQSTTGGDPVVMSPTSERAASFDLATLQSETLRIDSAVAQAKVRLVAWDGYTARLRACISEMNRRGLAAMRVDEAGAAWKERLTNAAVTVKAEAVAYEMALKEARATPRGSPTSSGLSSEVLRPVDPPGHQAQAGPSQAHASREEREDAEWKEVMDRAEAEKVAVLAKSGGTPRGSAREAAPVVVQDATEEAGAPAIAGVQIDQGGAAPFPMPATVSPRELQVMPASLPTTATVDSSPVAVAEAQPAQEAPAAAVAHTLQQKAVMPVPAGAEAVPRPTIAGRARPAAIPEVGTMPKQKGFMGWCASLCAPKK